MSLTHRLLRKLNHHRTTDVFFVGYPKTGNTWIRFLLGRYVQLACGLDDLPLFDEADRWGANVRNCLGFAATFTHRPLSWKRQKAADLDRRTVVGPFAGRKVVLITRHPLDTLVSFWFQSRLREQRFRGPLDAFLAHPVLGFEKYLRFHSIWREEHQRAAGFFLLRYEELRRDTPGTFCRLLRFLGVEADGRLVGEAVAFASFDNMKRLESSSGRSLRYRSSGAEVFATGDPENPEACHVRKGKVGGYREYLDERTVMRYEERLACDTGRWLGYAGPGGQG